MDGEQAGDVLNDDFASCFDGPAAGLGPLAFALPSPGLLQGERCLSGMGEDGEQPKCNIVKDGRALGTKRSLQTLLYLAHKRAATIPRLRKTVGRAVVFWGERPTEGS